ncbi:MAG: hypothetical protein ACI9MC_000541 [Kiritimatiellia bacterium]|jgi:hypothetical protein
MRPPLQTPPAAPRLVTPRAKTTDELYEILGMRREDLDNEERMSLIEALSDAPASKARAGAMTLACDISNLPAPQTSLHAGHVLETLDRRRPVKDRRNTVFLVIGAIGFMALGAVSWQAASTTTAAAPTTEVHRVRLEVDATHNGRSRPLAHRSHIDPDTVLHLTVATSGPGNLFVIERWGYGSSRALMPVSGQWKVEAGLHELPFGLTPHQLPLEVTYEAWLCPPDTTKPTLRDCRKDRSRITWKPAK